jgi:hypothetical protein
MSRRSIREYIQRKREDYEGEFPERKTRAIDEVCRTTGLSRKYVIRLLNGKVEYRERKGRGKTYKGDVVEVLKAVWRSAGCPCLPYFKAQVGMWADEYSANVEPIGGEARGLLLKMSARTMSRLLDGEVRVKPGWSKANRRSGRNGANLIKGLVPCASGEAVMACEVPPGDLQVDTFALGGGDASDNFFWILSCTDRRTQWTELSPAWNRSRNATCSALDRCLGRFPFPVQAIHSDNGCETLNFHVAAYLGQRPGRPFMWRSRPRRSNDNAHVEEKNRSVGRQLFGEIRLDCPGLNADLVELCAMWSDFTNFFRPCKMLVAKAKRAGGKGFACAYDSPRTPFERVLESKDLPEEGKRELAARKAKMVGIKLLAKIERKLQRIRRTQEKYNKARREHNSPLLAAMVADSALCAAPSGSSAPLRGKTSRRQLACNAKTARSHERSLGVQYLANQKPPPYLAGALSI